MSAFELVYAAMDGRLDAVKRYLEDKVVHFDVLDYNGSSLSVQNLLIGWLSD